MIAITPSLMICDILKMSCSTRQEWESSRRIITVDDAVCRSKVVSHRGERATETVKSCLTHYTVWVAESIPRNIANGTALRRWGVVVGADRC